MTCLFPSITIKIKTLNDNENENAIEENLNGHNTGGR